MIYVSIDIDKLNNFASSISSDVEELTKPFKSTNDADGFQQLSSHLGFLRDDRFNIGHESMAYYGDNNARFLIINEGQALAMPLGQLFECEYVPD